MAVLFKDLTHAAIFPVQQALGDLLQGTFGRYLGHHLLGLPHDVSLRQGSVIFETQVGFNVLLPFLGDLRNLFRVR